MFLRGPAYAFAIVINPLLYPVCEALLHSYLEKIQITKVML